MPQSKSLAVVAAAALFAAPLHAAETVVAVAANFTEPAKAIAAAFTRATGDTATLSFGSSGSFYTQMTHGAPFEVFLSADAERPAKLEADGLRCRGRASPTRSGSWCSIRRPPAWSMARARC